MAGVLTRLAGSWWSPGTYIRLSGRTPYPGLRPSSPCTSTQGGGEDRLRRGNASIDRVLSSCAKQKQTLSEEAFQVKAKANFARRQRSIEERLHLLQRHLPHHESDHVLSQALIPLPGGHCLEDLEARRRDGGFLDAVGARRLPDPTTAGGLPAPVRRGVGPGAPGGDPRGSFERLAFAAQGRAPAHRRDPLLPYLGHADARSRHPVLGVQRVHLQRMPRGQVRNHGILADQLQALSGLPPAWPWSDPLSDMRRPRGPEVGCARV